MMHFCGNSVCFGRNDFVFEYNSPTEEVRDTTNRTKKLYNTYLFCDDAFEDAVFSEDFPIESREFNKSFIRWHFIGAMNIKSVQCH